MEEKIVELLLQYKMHIAFAESCTGGLCAARLVNVASASKVLEISFVTYSEEAKMQYVNVAKNTLDKYGVVSTEVAAEMAEGVAKNACADVGVGVTGLAGPGGGVNPDGEDIPVGTVCFGFYIKGKCEVSKVVFDGCSRNEVRQLACDYVYEKLIDKLTEV
ncbi:MAG: CinA family protein [Lachnospiraceae bacterium]|nr:CinA family protein [Lachnospiraceae bacterium]